MVARAEPQEWCGSVAEMREDEFARCTVAQLPRLARLRIDQLGVHEPSRAEVHSRLFFALSPERRPDVADPHSLGHPCTPTRLECRPKRRLAPARFAGDEDSPHARLAQVAQLEEVGRVRRRHHDRVGP